AVRSNPNATPPRFLLAYQYLVEGNNDAAGTQFANIAKVEPKDQLSASLAKALTKAKESTTPPATATGPVLAGASAAPAPPAPSPRAATVPTAAPAPAASIASPPAAGSAEPPAPPPPPAELTGTWKATPSPDTAITLALQADGEYAWEVASK